MKSKMIGYVDRLHSGVERLYSDIGGLERLKNFGYSYISSYGSGLLFRAVLNGLIDGNTGLSKSLTPYDEILRPLAVYFTMFAFDSLSKKFDLEENPPAVLKSVPKKYRKYIPHIATLGLWTGGWEGLQYSGLTKFIEWFKQTPLGTVKDALMDIVAVVTYKSKKE